MDSAAAFVRAVPALKQRSDSASKEPMTAAAFVRAVIGRPWCENGQGPDAYDCWGLARACQKVVFGRDLPIVNHPSTLRALIETIEDHAVRDSWPEVSRPSHGDLVTMSHSVQPHHIGTYLALDGGRVLHAIAKAGVMCCTLMQLKLEGFRGLRFHRYQGSGIGDQVLPIPDTRYPIPVR